MIFRHPNFIVSGRSLGFAGIAALLLAVAPGCQERLDYDEYGEIIEEVPPRLNQPYPLPELEKSASGAEEAPGAAEK